MLFILCWVFYIAYLNECTASRVKDQEIIRLTHKINYKNKQLDSCNKILNSDKIVLFNGKIVYH